MKKIILECSGWMLFLVLWLAAGNPSDASPVQNGLADLDISDREKSVTLKGDWYFLWKEFADTTRLRDEGKYISMPGRWPEQKGFATYGLKVRWPKLEETYSIYVPPVHSAFRLYIDGELLGGKGSIDADGCVDPQSMAGVYTFRPENKQSWLVFEVANQHFVVGGIQHPPVLGTAEVVDSEWNRSLISSAFLIGGLMIIGFYHFGIYLLRTSDRSALYFAIICLLHAVRESLSEQTVLFLLCSDIDWFISMKILYSVFAMGAISFVLFIQSLFPDIFSGRLLRYFISFPVVYLFVIWLSPNEIYGRYLWVLALAFALVSLYIYYVTIIAYRRGYQGSLLVLAGMVIVLAAMIHDQLYEAGYFPSIFILPVAFLLFVLLQSFSLAQRFAETFKRSETLAIDLLKTRAAYRKQTEEKERAEKEKQIEEFKNRFFSNITHEFRTPLTIITFLTEQLEESLNGVNRQYLRSIRKNADQLLHLINQLLQIRNADSRGDIVSKSDIRIDDFLREIADMFHVAAIRKNIQLNLHSDGLSVDCRCDKDKLRKIVNNLVANAIKYTPSGGIVDIVAMLSAQSEDHFRLLLTVADTGSGIAEGEKEKIFERFYRSSNQHEEIGNGLGLAMVRELTDLLGGSISVDSISGKGSCYTVELPLEKPAHFESDPEIMKEKKFPSLFPVSPDSMSGEPVIVLAEDQPELGVLLAEKLGSRYRIHLAKSGTQAWELVQQELPDLVITDVMMPGMDGFALCEHIKNNDLTSHIGVIMLTARASQESVLQGLSDGANDYLVKPFHYKELELRVRNLLENRNLLRKHWQRRLSEPDRSIESNMLDPFLEKIYRFIDQNLDNGNLAVADLADHMSVSSRTLNRKLSSLLGISSNEIIRTYRLRKASEFLREGMTVAEAGYRSGFENPSYFGQCFKAQFGKTPGEFLLH